MADDEDASATEPFSYSGIQRLDALMAEVIKYEGLHIPRMSGWSFDLPEEVQRQAGEDILAASQHGIWAGFKFACALAPYPSLLDQMVKASLVLVSRQLAQIEDREEPQVPGSDLWAEIVEIADAFVRSHPPEYKG